MRFASVRPIASLVLLALVAAAVMPAAALQHRRDLKGVIGAPIIDLGAAYLEGSR